MFTSVYFFGAGKVTFIPPLPFIIKQGCYHYVDSGSTMFDDDDEEEDNEYDDHNHHDVSHGYNHSCSSQWRPKHGIAKKKKVCEENNCQKE